MLRFCILLRLTFSTWTTFKGINKYSKSAVVQMSTVFWPVYHVTCLKGPLKRDFLDICLTTSFKVGKFEIHQLWGSSFFSKCSNLNLNWQNAKKNSAIIFWFWDNCIWKCYNKLSLLKRGYLLPSERVF